MMCPKCERGELITIRFTDTGKKARVCNNCEVLLTDGEDTPRHVFTDGEKEYSVDTTEGEDQEHRSARYTDIK